MLPEEDGGLRWAGEAVYGNAGVRGGGGDEVAGLGVIEDGAKGCNAAAAAADLVGVPELQRPAFHGGQRSISDSNSGDGEELWRIGWIGHGQRFIGIGFLIWREEGALGPFFCIFRGKLRVYENGHMLALFTKKGSFHFFCNIRK